ncbi:alpha/beta hydrolase [Litoribrevibacter euphylliae]|uniref:Alpha/beta hydrolase n=1 Tax=Litoribrevibacter euphylliae TaxID=1834034 RepID=A0ABV7HLB1_9GAMM
MNTFVKKSLSCLVLSLSAASASTVNAAESSSIVFVHGAHFNADSWQPLQEQLNNQVTSYAVNLPGRNDNILPEKVTLDIAATSLCSFMASIPEEKKMVVAHSQGGAIVNASLSVCPDESIEKIVYVTAVAPLEDEGVFTKLNKADETHYFSGIHFNEQKQSLEISNQQNFANSFAQDANPSQQEWLVKNAVAEPAPIGEAKLKLNKERFNEVNKYYVYAKRDQIISLESQQKIAKDLDLKASFEIDSGHLPMLTKTEELSDLLIKISEM